MLRYLLAVLLATALPASAESIDCRVIGIAGGDIFACLTAKQERVRVRMAEIDAPEARQVYGLEAQHALSGYIFGKDVTLVVQGHDRHGRTLARVRAGDTDVNAEMVRSGAAWADPDYMTDRNLRALEAVAREFKRGLWALPKPDRQPPWQWREARR
ncbi:thermonuclease family protein [Pseudomonas sp. PS1]|uniref:Thermonuclease family protein n=1 Tax=Stutzerimonas marianensis TaxID=2929513 RepID=A0A9X2AR53_9GAMM|nr:thermonuclease family protein [Pseudomonas marianensis]MCJ0972155.1 thermonuclease family protein [Pseudomonas marianensis]